MSDHIELNFDEEEMMQGVYAFLKSKYGTINTEWLLVLFSLKSALHRYLEVRKKIDEVGIYNDDTELKNPLLSTEKDCLATILKISQKLGVSPFDSASIKKNEKATAEVEDDSEDFIDALTN